ncbi:DNA polymerase I [Clostridium sp. DL1XJH146]
MKKERLLILDGHSLMYRAFYGLPQFTNKEGLHTNAIYGFINMLYKIKDELEPDYIVTAFDRKAPTFRQKEYGEYKAHRETMPVELREQFPIMREILQKLAINIFEIDGFEADDLIGTLAQHAEKANIEVFIVTGDRDALQLATDNVKVVINKKGMTEKTIYDKDRMIEEYGVTPTEFIDCKGLMGDKSDNIPGVPGIGEKTAFKLIKEYGSVENVLDNIDNIKGKKIKENLIDFAEQAILSKRLATIVTDVPIEINLEEIKSKESYDISGVIDIYKKLEFKKLLQRFNAGEELLQEIESEDDEDIETVNIDIPEVEKIDTIEKLEKIVPEINGNVIVKFVYNNESLFSKLSFEKIYIMNNDNYYEIMYQQIISENKDILADLFGKIFNNEFIKVISHNAKKAFVVLRKDFIEFSNLIFDIEVAAYLIEPSTKSYAIKDIANTNSFDTMEEDKIDILELAYMDSLYNEYITKLKEANMEELFYNVEMPLIKVLSEMEFNGFKVDRKILDDLGEKLKIEIENTEKVIFEYSDEKFNINSPKQLGKILFEKLDLPVIKKTKTGYSTNADVLEKLKDKHPIIEKITYYRQITKLNSTYVEGLKNVIDEDNKIHTSFNQTVTTTGRLSSTEPNLQNIPIKYELGREVRKVFIPEEENILLSADYSQIELRVLAHISEDDNFIDAFIHHDDIHRKTASEVFKVPMEEVTSLMRSNAKAVNFGIVYGQGAYSLSQDLNIPRKEAKKYIELYFERYPKIKTYFDVVIKDAMENGYVTTILNRRRFLPELNSTSKIVKAAGERLAMNTPIQGSAADIIKLAMIKVYNRLNAEGLKSKLLLQVHDELILNVVKDEVDRVKAIVKEEMEGVIVLSVPLDVDMNIGSTWYDAK